MIVNECIYNVNNAEYACYDVMLFIRLVCHEKDGWNPNKTHGTCDVNYNTKYFNITLMVLSRKPLTIFSSSYCRQYTPLMFSLRQWILRRPCLPHLQFDSSLWNIKILKINNTFLWRPVYIPRWRYIKRPKITPFRANVIRANKIIFTYLEKNRLLFKSLSKAST